MEKRRSQRITYGFRAALTCSGQRYPVLIDNLSENGVGILTDPVAREPEFTAGSDVRVAFEPEDDSKVVLTGRIAWVKSAASHGMTRNLGIEISDPQWERVSFFL